MRSNDDDDDVDASPPPSRRSGSGGDARSTSGSALVPRVGGGVGFLECVAVGWFPARAPLADGDGDADDGPPPRTSLTLSFPGGIRGGGCGGGASRGGPNAATRLSNRAMPTPRRRLSTDDDDHASARIAAMDGVSRSTCAHHGETTTSATRPSKSFAPTSRRRLPADLVADFGSALADLRAGVGVGGNEARTEADKTAAALPLVNSLPWARAAPRRPRRRRPSPSPPPPRRRNRPRATSAATRPRPRRRRRRRRPPPPRRPRRRRTASATSPSAR
eukprot:30961-Pelagococcus_subviridis.AAC.19